MVCKEVLPYIPENLVSIAVRNFARLSSHFVLLSWNVLESIDSLSYREMAEEERFEDEGYTVEKYMTARLHVLLKKRKDCCVLTRRNLPLINYRTTETDTFQ